MYGLILVEPKDGLPKVDKEFYIMQSEFYTKADPQKRKVDGVPLYVLDGDRVRSKAPTYTVFNGRYNGLVDKPLNLGGPNNNVTPPVVDDSGSTDN